MSFGRFKDDSNSSKKPSIDSPDSTRESGAGSSSEKKDAYIGKGSKIIGSLTFAGPTELDGEVEGEVIAQDRLVIGESAHINAKLSGTEVIVKGAVSGDISASKRLVLKKTARVLGSLSSPLLTIEEGVIFEGKIAMIQAEKVQASEKRASEAVQSGSVQTGAVGAKTSMQSTSLAKSVN